MKNSNKIGFTLLEMLLAIAITLIISGLFFTLLVTIRSSYYRSYNDDDCADIAQMYAQALENQVLYDCQNGVADTIKIDDHGILTSSANDFEFSNINNFNNAGTNQKWDIRMVCHFDSSTNVFSYSFYFIDKYINPNYLHYVYEGSFWIPNYMPYVHHNMGDADEFTPGPGNVYSWDYNYSGSATHNSFNINITNPGTVDSYGNLTASSLEGGYYTRVTTEGAGRMVGDDTAPTASVPYTSSSVTIAAAGGGGT